MGNIEQLPQIPSLEDVERAIASLNDLPDSEEKWALLQDLVATKEGWSSKEEQPGVLYKDDGEMNQNLLDRAAALIGKEQGDKDQLDRERGFTRKLP